MFKGFKYLSKKTNIASVNYNLIEEIWRIEIFIKKSNLNQGYSMS